MNRQNTWSFNRKCQKEIKRVDWLSFSSETRHVTVRLGWKTSAETHTHTRFTSKCNEVHLLSSDSWGKSFSVVTQNLITCSRADVLRLTSTSVQTETEIDKKLSKNVMAMTMSSFQNTSLWRKKRPSTLTDSLRWPLGPDERWAVFEKWALVGFVAV